MSLRPPGQKLGENRTPPPLASANVGDVEAVHTAEEAKEEGGSFLAHRCACWGSAAQRTQSTFHRGCIGRKGQSWTAGGGLLATCWGLAAESAPRLASFTGAPASAFIGSQGLIMVFPRVWKAGASRVVRSTWASVDAGLPGELRTAPQAPGASAGEVRRKCPALCSGAAPGSPRDTLKDMTSVPQGSAGCTLDLTRCGAHKGRGDAVVRTS